MVPFGIFCIVFGAFAQVGYTGVERRIASLEGTILIIAGAVILRVWG